VPTCVLEKLKKVYHQIIYKDNKIDINNFNSFGDTIRSDININEDISFKNINGLFAFWLLNKELKR
ncbi:MAG: hypothetical protein J7J96_10150, partial [Sulfurimonas sp.]|nr:hypothetical protein [Sulfurimonas sp.]